MGRFLQFLLILLLIRIVWRAVTRLLGGPEFKTVDDGSPGSRQPIYRGQMVRDPVCGVYIPKQSSVMDGEGEEIHYFCSEACREAFRRNEIPVK
jgi:YHS domain-containing protein